ncbi:MAG: ribonuclease HII [candidate division NC10 bacterium]|nr:ribonuclease HII [candidate division NC10 bacterium]
MADWRLKDRGILPKSEICNLKSQGYTWVAGVDEAGRGALAGPVVAAAVILPPRLKLEGLKDSKLLPPRRREALYQAIQEKALGIGVGTVESKTIDALNILRATLLAMERAIASLPFPPEFLLIDGRDAPRTSLPHRALPHGDDLCPSISAASIIAKVYRDRIMNDYHLQFPQYGFARHKGYGTPEHLKALARYGPTSIHRLTFRRVMTRELW